MRLPVTGESAAQLPWLWPEAHSLAALAQPLSPETWPLLRRDPAALVLVHRGRPSFSSGESPVVSPARFLEPRVLELVGQWLQHDRGRWCDGRHFSILPIYQTALAIAHHAQIIAKLTRGCDPGAAWTAGLLAPLGWFAVAAVDPVAVVDCRCDSMFAEYPLEAQQRHWGLDHAAISRRLARRWQLPDWIRFAVGHLDLSIESAVSLGADPALFATIQLAVGMAEHAGYSLALNPLGDAEQLMARLKIGVGDLRSIQDQFRDIDLAEVFEPEWQDPREIPDLSALLQEAIEIRRSEAVPFLTPLELDLDRLHKTLVRWKRDEEERLQTAKLAALAEFAAGASHEINNPLAVISGQSQYLLHREIEEDFRPALESIVRQTQRIHAILTELMQFARPPQLSRKQVPLGDIIHSAIEAFSAMANEAGVTIDRNAISSTIWVEADPRHLQTAIGCLLRNAIEAAAPAKGWARVRAQTSSDHVEICVEDSGPGPTAVQREHLFDPFFSGRSAGRGRGLGLPTAWRMAREHGGDVRYVPMPDGPTRFVLSLPLSASSTQNQRLSA